MPRKELSPEARERRREAGRLGALRSKEARLRRALDKEGAPPVDESDLEDVSLPGSYGVPPSEVEEPELPLPQDADPSDPYTLWLTLLDRDTRETFSAAKLKEIWAEQNAKAAAEKRIKQEKEITQLALSTARSQQGLIPAQTAEAIAVKRQNAKPVSFLVQLPPAQQDGQPADVGLRIDGNLILNGTRHRCTYGEAASLREILYRHGQGELLFKGENIRYRAYLMGQAMGSVNTQIDANERGIVR